MRQDVQKNEVVALEEKLQENSDERLGELTDDCRLLVLSHMPLAYAMAWRMKDYGVSVKDLRQEGCLGLCEAALRYDESVGCRFATYASYWCRKKIFLAIRHQNPSEDLQEETLRLPEDEDERAWILDVFDTMFTPLETLCSEWGRSSMPGYVNP